MMEGLHPEAWRSLRHDWLWVYRGPVPATGQWSSAITVPPGIFFVERGEARLRAEGLESHVQPGQAFFSKPGLRRQWFAPGTRLLSVGFRSQWPDGSPLLSAGLNCVLEVPALRSATLRLFRQVHRGRRVVTYREALAPATRSLVDWAKHDAAFLIWLAACLQTLADAGVGLATRADRNRRLAHQLLDWLNSLPSEQATPSLPPHFPLGPRRADQLLRENLGLGLREFMENLRLTRARERVLAGVEPLKAIAFSLGFRHASHFTAWFRRHTGQSPSACRSGGTEAV
jgi:AraC-like DNA-binding protein